MNKLFPIVLALLFFGCENSLEKRVESLERKTAHLNKKSKNLIRLEAKHLNRGVADGNLFFYAEQSSDNPFEYFGFMIDEFDENRLIRRISSEKATVIEYDKDIVTIELKDGFISQFSKDTPHNYIQFDSNIVRLDSDHNFFKKIPFK